MAMVTMYPPQANSPNTTLASSITDVATTITVTVGSILPAHPNLLTIGADTDAPETVLLTNKSSNTLTVTRAQDGTTAKAWDAGAEIQRTFTAADHQALIDNIGELASRDKLIASGAGCVLSNNSTRIAPGSFAVDLSFTDDNTKGASGVHAYAEGYKTLASGDRSHAEGNQTTASGTPSHAEGSYTTASGNYSHAEGLDATASGNISHAEGRLTNATGNYSHAQNYYATAQGMAQTAIGQYNVAQGAANSIAATDHAFIIGNGTADDARSNALTVDWSGNVDIAAEYKRNGIPIRYDLFFDYDSSLGGCYCHQTFADVLAAYANGSILIGNYIGYTFQLSRYEDSFGFHFSNCVIEGSTVRFYQLQLEIDNTVNFSNYDYDFG